MNFYFNVASALDKLDSKEGSIKSVISTLPEKDRKRAAALVIDTLKYKAVLNDVIQTSELLKHERQKLNSQNLVLLLVHDLLFAKGKIQAGDGPIKQAILRHKTRLQSELTKIKVKRGVQSVSELAHEADSRADLIPRYVRVNTLLWSTEDAIQHFLSQGFEERDDLLVYKKALKRDVHISDLLLFHPSTLLNDSPLLSSGKIILQDKASCFPAVVLSPPARADARVIDATAAPGNKTTLLSALMKGRGKLYAFERDKKRFATLKKMVSNAQCGNIEPTSADFLTVDPHDPKYASVSHILLDPSCSGSGIVNRLDHLLDTEGENDLDGQEDRLQKLASFQLMIIKHAMKFPAAEKIVYSTCSVHAAENEDVVCQALACDEAIRGNYVLADRKDVLPSWPRRGMPERTSKYGVDAESMVRCIPGEDHTNGFFVACFVRRKEGQEVNKSGLCKGDKGGRGEEPVNVKKRQVDQSEEDQERSASVGDHRLGGADASSKRKNKKKRMKR